MSAWDAHGTMRSWPPRRWGLVGGGGVGVAVLIGVPTAVVPNPWFGREIPPTWWSIPVLVVTSVLSGLLLATYVADDARLATEPDAGEASRPLPARLDDRRAMAGGLLAFFAVGCPVCNKLVLIALGSAGAVSWFAPVQPWLAVASIVLLVVALRRRLEGLRVCVVVAPESSATVNRRA